MELDYGKGAGYKFQWLISFYIYTILKNEKYSIDESSKVPNDFLKFRKNILKFREKSLKKFGVDFKTKVEVMLEGEGRCFEDINLLSENGSKKNDNLIFIQVKTKGGEKTITKNDGVYKSIINFIKNINFQRTKNEGNILFFILSNTLISHKLNKQIINKDIDFYISIINEIITDNNKRKKSKNNLYPEYVLNNIGINYDVTIELLLDLKYNNIKDIDVKKYIKLYNYDYILKLDSLVKDINIILDNIFIINSLKIDFLINELESFYGRHGEGGYLDNKDKIENLAIDISEIKNSESKFDIYRKYLYTYFSAKDGGKLINELDSISKGKFI